MDGNAPATNTPTAAGPDGESPLESIARRRAELGERLPRIGLFLFDCLEPERLRKTLERIPEALEGCLSEAVIVQDRPLDPPLPPPRELAPGRSLRPRIHRNPGGLGYGGSRKAVFEYALRSGLDYVITMRGDGSHPPEALPQLVYAALSDRQGLVVASRLQRRLDTLHAGMPLWRLAGHALATGVLNRVLGLRLHDYLSSFRLYSTHALRRIPYHLDANDRLFDVHLLIQFRALGAPVLELTVLPAWREAAQGSQEVGHVARAAASALDYRLHQLHVTRRGRYFVEHDVHYTLKLSETGSHMQIVAAIAPESRVLDLGCSQGLLARPLRERQVRTTGVDAHPPEHIRGDLERYFERDLEQPLELPVGREFDYVVIADVIEHLRHRTQLLRGARRFLKEGGRLVISTPNVALWFYRLSLLVGRFEYGPRGVLDRTHVHLFTRDSFRRQVEQAGFHVVGERVTALPFEVVFESTGRSRLLQRIARLYHALARLWPKMFAYQFILEAEITTLDEESISG